MSILVDKIKNFLEASKITIAEAERNSGLKPNALHNILKGRSKKPNKENIVLIAKMLGCAPSELEVEVIRTQKKTLSNEEKSGLRESVIYIMNALNVSVSQLARLCHVSPATLSKLSGQNAGTQNPSHKVLSALATYVSCSEEDLLMKRVEKFTLPMADKEDEADISPLRNALAAYMQQENISISELERKARIETNALRAIIQGASKKPMAETIAAIAGVLDVTVQDLIEGKIEKKENRIDLFSVYTLEHPELLKEALVLIIETAKEKRIIFTLHQICKMLQEAYLYAVRKEPASIQKSFIEWMVDKVGGRS